MQTLISDAANPMKRTLHIQTIVVESHDRLQFEFDVPSPAIFRRMFIAVAQGAIAGAPVRKRYYVLPYGVTAEGAGVGDMLFVACEPAPNGMPVAIYELPPPKPLLAERPRGLV